MSITLKPNVWVDIYRPHKVSDCILPSEPKKFFEKLVEEGTLSQSLLLYGSAGTGKTTVALALCEELGLDHMFINASEDNGIDMVRNQIRRFATAKSLNTSKKGKAKVIILDEADFLNINSAQPALRGVMEEFSKIGCHFILTCNHRNKLMDAIQSRCANVDFTISSQEKKHMLVSSLKAITHMLDREGVSYDKAVIAEVIMKYFPDLRRCIHELQRYSKSSGGNIDTGILSSLKDVQVDDLIEHIKSKKYESVRKWVFADNPDIDPSVFYGRLSNALHTKLNNQSKPMADVLLADYQYKSAFVPDQQVNLMALLVEIMMQCEFV